MMIVAAFSLVGLAVGNSAPGTHYRGTWHVAFETSLFIPAGEKSCLETAGSTQCFELVGKVLPWPGRWECAREYQVEFVGHPDPVPRVGIPRVVVDRLIAAKRLADPYDWNCDPGAHPELKSKQ